MKISRARFLGLLIFPALLTAPSVRASDPCSGGIVSRLTELGYDANRITAVRTADNSTVINQRNDWLSRHAQGEIDRIRAANPPKDTDLPVEYEWRIQALVSHDPKLQDNLREQRKIDRLLVASDQRFEHIVVYSLKGKPPTVVARVFESKGRIVSFTTYAHDEKISKDPFANDVSSGQRCDVGSASLVSPSATGEPTDASSGGHPLSSGAE